jgi:signal transduction histidine kinase
MVADDEHKESRGPLLFGTELSHRAWVNLDWALAAAGFVAAELELRSISGQRANKVDAALALVIALSVAVRRRYPLLVLIIAGVSVAIVDGIGKPSWTLTVLLTLAGYTAGGAVLRSRSIVVIPFVVAALVVAAFANGVGSGGIVSAIGLVAAYMLGDSVAVRRNYEAQLAEHEELERLQRSDLAVQDERMRIARELHDGVAHALAVITLQAGATRRLLGPDDDASTALEAIEAQGRAAQDGLDAVLGLMRDDTRPADRPPAPGLAALEDLVDSVRAAGIRVELRRRGTEQSLPTPVQLVAYRIVQEALTNVVKHAPGAPTSVDVVVSPSEIRIEVVDVSPTPTPLPGRVATDVGHGIVGMRERAEAFGGTLSAEPLPNGGGFRVVAEVPIGRS